MNREAWLEQRRSAIGGTEWKDVFNLEPRGCARRLAYDKRRFPPDYPELVTDAMERGLEVEDWLAERYVRLTGLRVRRVPWRPDRRRPWLGGTVDRLVGTDGLLETKAPGRQVFRRVKLTGRAGHEYELQVQAYFARYPKRTWAHLMFQSFEPFDFLILEVAPDPAVIGQLLEVGGAWWDRFIVQGGGLPDRLPDPKDPRCGRCPWRKTCRGDELLQVIDQKGEAVVDTSLDPLILEVLELQAEVKASDAAYEDACNRLREAMGKRTLVQASGARVTFPLVERAGGLDRAALQKAHPTLDLTKYQKPATTYRALRVWPT